MRIIISPAKKMNRNEDLLVWEGKPVFWQDGEKILAWMRKLSYSQAKELWCCNDSIAEKNYKWLQDMDLHRNLTPAILAYDGIQYQYMAPAVFENRMLDYVQEHLRILSGFYGVLKLMDGVVPYRLEMQAKLSVEGKKDLYDFWGDRLCRQVSADTDVVLNLASKEYSAAVEKYLPARVRYITCTFGELQDGKVRQKGTFAKMARGEMVRFLAENRITQPDQVKEFRSLEYRYAEEYSSEREYVFLK